jgi:hypothetical protein
VQTWRLEGDILELHRIWNFFRSKFQLRSADWLRDFLKAADEFAWHCYEPAQRLALAADPHLKDVKEPPLVFLTENWSALAVSRGTRFLVERDRYVQLLAPSAFDEATQKLPIPVVGVPWTHLGHLADAVIIGHEVGHAVERDFGLLVPLQDAVGAAVPPERREAWRSWTREVFGDVYGCLATGPAFVGMLIDFLAPDFDEQKTVRLPAPEGSWGAYPPAPLRTLLNLELLRGLGCCAEAHDQARALGGQLDGHNLTAFEADLKGVVGAMLGTKLTALGGATVREVLPYWETMHEHAAECATNLLAGNPVRKDGDMVRQLFAAARLSFEKDPAAVKGPEVRETILRLVLNEILDGPRAGPGAAAGEDADREAGAQLFDFVIGLHAAGGSAG